MILLPSYSDEEKDFLMSCMSASSAGEDRVNPEVGNIPGFPFSYHPVYVLQNFSVRMNVKTHHMQL
jgi:hypothetical protein